MHACKCAHANARMQMRARNCTHAIARMQMHARKCAHANVGMQMWACKCGHANVGMQMWACKQERRGAMEHPEVETYGFTKQICTSSKIFRETHMEGKRKLPHKQTAARRNSRQTHDSLALDVCKKTE